MIELDSLKTKNYMRCEHSKTKIKLVSFAFDFRGKHEQWFCMKKCCSECGKMVEK